MKFCSSSFVKVSGLAFYPCSSCEIFPLADMRQLSHVSYPVQFNHKTCGSEIEFLLLLTTNKICIKEEGFNWQFMITPPSNSPLQNIFVLYFDNINYLIDRNGVVH